MKRWDFCGWESLDHCNNMKKLEEFWAKRNVPKAVLSHKPSEVVRGAVSRAVCLPEAESRRVGSLTKRRSMALISFWEVTLSLASELGWEGPSPQTLCKQIVICACHLYFPQHYPWNHPYPWQLSGPEVLKFSPLLREVSWPRRTLALIWWCLAKQFRHQRLVVSVWYQWRPIVS